MNASVDIRASGSLDDLLAEDAAAPWVDFQNHAAWRAACAGELDRAALAALVLGIYPAVAGPGRYVFSAKVSQLSRDDGARLFKDLYTQNTDPLADADAGWRRVGAALGLDDAAFDAAAGSPSAEAADYVDIVREHGLSRSPAEATMAAWVMERQLPLLWGRLADALVAHYGVDEAAVAYLRYEAGRADHIAKWIDHLMDAYVRPASPYQIFEARRAGREAAWAWIALTETALGDGA